MAKGKYRWNWETCLWETWERDVQVDAMIEYIDSKTGKKKKKEAGHTRPATVVEAPDAGPREIKKRDPTKVPRDDEHLLKVYLDEYNLMLRHQKGNTTPPRYVGYLECLIRHHFEALSMKGLKQRLARIEKNYGTLPKLERRWKPGLDPIYPHKPDRKTREAKREQEAKAKAKAKEKEELRKRLADLLEGKYSGHALKGELVLSDSTKKGSSIDDNKTNSVNSKQTKSKTTTAKRSTKTKAAKAASSKK
jgi:hypothetical protein